MSRKASWMLGLNVRDLLQRVQALPRSALRTHSRSMRNLTVRPPPAMAVQRLRLCGQAVQFVCDSHGIPDYIMRPQPRFFTAQAAQRQGRGSGTRVIPPAFR